MDQEGSAKFLWNRGEVAVDFNLTSVARLLEKVALEGAFKLTPPLKFHCGADFFIGELTRCGFSRINEVCYLKEIYEVIVVQGDIPFVTESGDG